MILRRLERLMRAQDRKRVPLFLAAACLASLMQGIAFVLLVPCLEALLRGAEQEASVWLLAILAAVAGAWWTTHTATLRSFDLALALLRNLRMRLGEHLVRLPLGWFTPVRTARISGTISQGVMELLALPAHQLMPLVQACVVPPVVVAGMALFNLKLAATAALLFPCIGLVYWWAGRLGLSADRAVHKAAEEAGQRVAEFAQAQAVLRAYGVVTRGHGALETALRQQNRAGRRQLWMVLPPLLANSWLVQLGYLGLLAMMVSLGLGGSDPAHVITLVALMVPVARMLEPLGDVASSGAGIRMASAQLSQVEGILAEPPLSDPSHPSPPPTNSAIGFKSVRFGHGDGPPILDGLDFVLEQNSTTALVGPSGAGKSTLLHLIARFFDVNAGAVTIGGVDVRALEPQALSALVSPVFQNTHLFSGSIRDNVLMARPDADEAALSHVAALSGLDAMLARLPGGWQCTVGEGGHGLSGGERQRVCIARALLKNAPILLLDEPTSALDAHNRATFGQMLATLHGHRTILVIAHQYEWIAIADRVLVLERGRLVEDGAPSGLLKRGGPFAALHDRRRAQRAGWHVSRET